MGSIYTNNLYVMIGSLCSCRLISEGKLTDALAVSDRCLRNGASDKLLQLLIEQEERSLGTGQIRAYGSHNLGSDTWQYCLRLRDKKLAAQLALKYLRSWDLDAASNVITMCMCHLPEKDPMRSKVVSLAFIYVEVNTLYLESYTVLCRIQP